MNRRRVSVPAALFAILCTACGGGGSTEPPTGTLVLELSGLPAGVNADVTVGGPGGYHRSVRQSETLSGLRAGSYTVTAYGVVLGETQFVPNPSSQAVAVTGGDAASAGVVYLPVEHTLAVTVNGLPAGTDAAITVTGPQGYSRPVTASETLAGLASGLYTVTALPVTDGAEQFTPSPSSQTVSVTGSAAATVAYSTGSTSGFNLRIDGVYLVQSVQKYDRSVPLVRERDALLRVFVTANQVNTAAPDVHVTFYSGGNVVAERTISAPGPSTPLAVSEGTLNSSWNVVVEGSLIQPNLAIVARVDPANEVAEGDENDNVFPGAGTPLALDVRSAAPFRVQFVPVITLVNGQQGNVTQANRSSYLEPSMRVHPLTSWDATVHAPYTTKTDKPLQADNANNIWSVILSEINALRNTESSSRYYYGVVNPGYGSGVAGIGYIGRPVALGWDKSGSRGWIAAHEWGHNWGRNHAPCGGAGGPDLNYPYAGGEIGAVGYDVVNAQLKPMDAHDLMGYCEDEWISDYTYRGVMSYREAEGSGSGMASVVQPGLLVWGRIEAGRAVLEPVLRVVARPSLPDRPGPYRVEGRADDGTSVFALDFEPLEVADDPRGSKHFAFVVPLRPERAARVATVRLEGAGVSAERAQPASATPRVEVTRAGPGRLALRWDAAAAPMLLVRDAATGQVLSFARGGSAEIAAPREEVTVTAPGGAARELRLRAR